ncbi:hypothetical protein DENSPDRAFT_753783, partial [Dentipellis sp. KUC8613]
MNPAPVLPEQWDSRSFHRAIGQLHCIPACTDRMHLPSCLSAEFVASDVAAAKVHLHDRHQRTTACGIDKVSYADLMEIPNNSLATLANKCLTSPILPRDYCLIGLESCLLKFVTLLIEARLRTWADESCLLPDSQNGFRPGFRTNNNVFILRCALDAAHATGMSVYATFVDLTNAFPSTNHPALWLKLYRLGFHGPMFD